MARKLRRHARRFTNAILPSRTGAGSFRRLFGGAQARIVALPIREKPLSLREGRCLNVGVLVRRQDGDLPFVTDLPPYQNVPTSCRARIRYFSR